MEKNHINYLFIHFFRKCDENYFFYLIIYFYRKEKIIKSSLQKI